MHSLVVGFWKTHQELLALVCGYGSTVVCSVAWITSRVLCNLISFFILATHQEEAARTVVVVVVVVVVTLVCPPKRCCIQKLLYHILLYNIRNTRLSRPNLIVLSFCLCCSFLCFALFSCRLPTLRLLPVVYRANRIRSLPTKRLLLRPLRPLRPLRLALTTATMRLTMILVPGRMRPIHCAWGCPFFLPVSFGQQTVVHGYIWRLTNKNKSVMSSSQSNP